MMINECDGVLSSMLTETLLMAVFSNFVGGLKGVLRVIFYCFPIRKTHYLQQKYHSKKAQKASE